MQDFKRLKVWKRAYDLTLTIYRVTATFPREERYELTSQLRKSAFSVPANIAEGSKRRTDADFAHFLNIGEGSITETSCFLMLGKDLGYLPAETADPLIREADEIGAMLFAFRKTVEKTRAARTLALGLLIAALVLPFLLL